MNDYVKSFLKKLLGLLVTLASIGLVIYGQRSVSYSGLGMMLLGLAGILLVLYIYNKSIQ